MVGPNPEEPFPKVQGRISMFIAGFIMLTPHRIAMTCAPHILKRYHLPPDVVGLFIYKIHTPMELSNVLGQYIANIVAWIVRIEPLKAPRIIYRIFSIVFVWLMFISGILSFILFKSGDDYGNFNYFFWSVIFMTFTNGLYCAPAFKLEGFIASMYGAGVPSSGFFTFFLHKICEWLSVRFDWEDFDHSILKVQFWVTIITLFISSTIWTVDIGIDIWDTQPTAYPNTTVPNKTAIDFGTFNSEGKELNDTDLEPRTKGIHQLFEKRELTSSSNAGDDTGHAADWSPIFMLATSLGSVYFFYPSISPYQLVDSDVGKKIDLWVQFTAAIPNFGVAILDIIEEISGGSTHIGPSTRTWLKDESWYWQLSWIAIIPYLTCICIFLSFMHYPEGFFARHMKSKKWLVYIVCITFNFFQECLESIGFAGAGVQIHKDNHSDFFISNNDGKINFDNAPAAFNDDIAAFNVLLTITIVNISILN